MLNVLVPLDGSEVAERAISHLPAIVAPFVAKIVLLRVVTPAEFREQETFSRVDWRLQKCQARAYLEGVARTLEASGVPCELRVEEGQPAEIILETAREFDTQLLVMSSHGRGGAFEFRRGGDASKTLSAFGASVLLINGRDVAREHGEIHYQHLFVPVDGSFRSESALRVATMLAQLFGARLTVACIAEQTTPPSIVRQDTRAISICHELADLTRMAAERRLARIKSEIPRHIDLHTVVTLARDPVDGIAEVLRSADADLVVASDNILSRETAAMDARIAGLNLPMLLLRAETMGTAFQELRTDPEFDLSNADVV